MMTLQLYWSSIGGVEDGDVRYGGRWGGSNNVSSSYTFSCGIPVIGPNSKLFF